MVHLPCPAIEIRNLVSIAGAEDRAEIDRLFSQVRARIQKRFGGLGEDGGRANMRIHASAGKWLSLLSPESRMRTGEADIAKKHHWNRVMEAARFEHGVRNVEGEIDTGIFGVRFVPPHGIIF